MFESIQWMKDALCRSSDPEIFFPGKGPSGSKEAIEICKQCPVSTQCLTYAIDEGIDYGVWGGVNEHRRSRLSGAGASRRSLR